MNWAINTRNGTLQPKNSFFATSSGASLFFRPVEPSPAHKPEIMKIILSRVVQSNIGLMLFWANLYSENNNLEKTGFFANPFWNWTVPLHEEDNKKLEKTY